ncbi:MarR family winged helix-turn-helix transcriptional regulator [Microbacterium sp. LRZ72]|uniref:MarR family winged helix-turn-helix transcriptional regulator n=1 Tax=Microbacterium sp. LRZ72 TaxID=2942481 RepID=UPI0029A32010|nr:MarR family winged helix-turn-helix transcriptional regulator [Microbacterium sp. LRZ72]MDX2378037.1 MarR family winged helix-turn-helix transcriptional regulator [Microbacterium sp. LRZ72]
MHPMNISRAVARLRAKDRLVSTTDSLNHRRRNLTLTDAGRAIYHDLIISAQEQARSLLEVLTIAERQFLTAILDRLLERALEIAAPARGD